MFCCGVKMRVEQLEDHKELVYCPKCGKCHVDSTIREE